MTTMDVNRSNDWSEQMTAVLERQQALVLELAGYARQQTAMIESSQTDALLDLLKRRQEVIDAFTQTQGELSSLTRGFEDRLAAVEPSRRDRIRTLLSSIGESLSAVMARDEQDQAALANRRNQTRSELNSLETARHARGAYGGGPSSAQPRTQYADRNA